MSVSSSRADVGILAPVWNSLADMDTLDLHIFLTGMHCKDQDAKLSVPASAIVHRGGEDISGSGDIDPATAMGRLTEAAGKLCATLEPDLLMVIGDRIDMIPAAVSSLPYNIPIMHLAGGDITEGAIDDRIRHALTKLSHVHCVINQEAAYRIAGMGEEAWRIHITGGTGLDTLNAVPRMSQQEVLDALGLPSLENLRIATVHPETNAGPPETPLDALLVALTGIPGPTVFTAPNSDPGGEDMRRKILEFVEAHEWAVFIDTLGAERYANAMRWATVMVGNSSSGIVEAGLFGLNVIDIGDRQRGRLRGKNVHNCVADPESIEALLRKLTSRATGRPVDSLYGDGNAAKRVGNIVGALPSRRKLLMKKHCEATVEFTVPWAI